MAKVGKFFVFVLRIVAEYITLFATIIASIYIVISSQFVPYEDNTLLLWIIGLVAAMAIAQASEKMFKLNKIEKEVLSINAYISKTKKNTCKRSELSGLEHRLSGAKTVTITGGSLKRISDECYADLDELLKSGCKLEIIMINPQSDAANYLCDNIVYETRDYDEYRTSIHYSLNRFKSLKDKYGNKVTILLSSRVPPFSLMVKNEKLNDAEIKVELYSYRVPTRERLQFTFNKKENKTDCDFFIKQLKALRDSSTVV